MWPGYCGEMKNNNNNRLLLSSLFVAAANLWCSTQKDGRLLENKQHHWSPRQERHGCVVTHTHAHTHTFSLRNPKTPAGCPTSTRSTVVKVCPQGFLTTSTPMAWCCRHSLSLSLSSPSPILFGKFLGTCFLVLISSKKFHNTWRHLYTSWPVDMM